MDTKEWLQNHLMSAGFSTSGHRKLAKRIICNDGLMLSVQASAGHYCSPREDRGPWHSVEIGFPSKRLPALAKYAEEPKRMTKTVFGWVPLDELADELDRHGGIRGEA